MNSPSPTFVLVSGSMRSGTTLVGDFLYSRFAPSGPRPRHPTISFSNDVLNSLRELSRELRIRVTPPIARCDPDRVIPFDTAKEEFATKLVNDIRAVAPTIEPATIVGIKQTATLTEADLLRQCFPVVKHILPIRDPRDTYASLKGRAALLAGHSADVLESCLVQVSILASVSRYLDASPRDTAAFKYETIVSDPRAAIESILGFIGADPAKYDWEGMATVCGNSSHSGQDALEPRSSAGIYSSSIGAFRTTISEFECYCVETICAEMMEKFGYRREASHSADNHADFQALIPKLRAIATQRDIFLALPAEG